jgi:peptidylprolyl isomerase
MKYFSIYMAIALSFSSMGFSEESIESTVVDSKQQEILKVSEAFGHLMGKHLESTGLQFDIQYVIKGLQDAANGKTSPMTEMECIQAITAAQESAFKEQSSVNLTEAEEFLKNNSSLEGIVSLEEGKVQYKVEKEGSGDVVAENGTPLIRYTGKFLNGSVFGASKEDEPISLEEVIAGLKTGVSGMKEGEKRTIYIHPDLAYGTKGGLPPNSLLTFEIEIVKAAAPIIEEHLEDVSSDHEIALPEESFEDSLEDIK